MAEPDDLAVLYALLALTDPVVALEYQRPEPIEDFIASMNKELPSYFFGPRFF